jgi:hypothetical protein
MIPGYLADPTIDSSDLCHQTMTALKVLTIGVAELVRVRIFPEWQLVGTRDTFFYLCVINERCLMLVALVK